MTKAIKIIIALCILFCFFIAFKTFFINRPPLSPELTANFYLQQEQFGLRSEAEKFLFDSSPLTKGEEFENFDKVEILGENYNNLKNVAYKRKEGPRNFKVKEVKKEKGNIRVSLTETILREVYFFNFLLSKEYQKDGKTEFEVLLTKTGDWWSGQEWKVLKIDSSTLIQSAKIGETREIKKGILIKPILSPSLKKGEKERGYILEVFYKNQSGFKNQEGKDCKISSSEWKIVGQRGQEIKPNFLEERLESGEEKEVEFEFSLPEDFLLKEIVFRNEGKEIHFVQ